VSEPEHHSLLIVSNESHSSLRIFIILVLCLLLIYSSCFDAPLFALEVASSGFRFLQQSGPALSWFSAAVC